MYNINKSRQRLLACHAKILLKVGRRQSFHTEDGRVSMLGSLSVYSLGRSIPNARGQMSDQFVSGHRAKGNRWAEGGEAKGEMEGLQVFLTWRAEFKEATNQQWQDREH